MRSEKKRIERTKKKGQTVKGFSSLSLFFSSAGDFSKVQKFLSLSGTKDGEEY